MLSMCCKRQSNSAAADYEPVEFAVIPCFFGIYFLNSRPNQLMQWKATVEEERIPVKFPEIG